MKLVLVAILTFLSQAAVAESEATGRICLASIKPPNDQPKSLYNPSGGNPDVTYSVKVGDREPMQFSQESGQWLEGLALDSEVPVVIYEDGEQSASFFVDFGRGEVNKCLFLRTLYLTWQVWDWSRTGPWCDCTHLAESE